MKRQRVRSGVVVQTVLTAESDADVRELLPTGADLIQAQIDRAQANEAQATGDRAKAAATARRLLADALAMLGKGDADGVACNLIWAMQNLWLADVRQVEPEIVTGARARRGTRKGNEVKTEDARLLHARWQEKASAIWARNKVLSRPEVAERISQEMGGAADYIRKHIRNPHRIGQTRRKAKD